MQPKYALSCLVFALLLAQSPEASAQKSESETRVSVAVFCSADDGLTLKLCDAVERSLRRSRGFSLSGNRALSTLRLRIPTNVHWESANGHIQVQYKVEFWSAEDVKKLGEVAGSCREIKLSDCAKRILLKAEEAAGRLGTN